MKNTFSLHKVGIAKFAGLFTLAILAIAFFVIPMATAAVGPQKDSDKTPLIGRTIKIFYLGKVIRPTISAFNNATIGTTDPNSSTGTSGTTGTTGSKFPFTLKKTIATNELVFGSWLMCGIQDPATNTIYTFMCTVTSFNNTDKVLLKDITSKNIAVVIGPPADTSLTDNNAIKKYMGKKGRLVFSLNAGRLTIPSGVEVAATGWS
jgi:hypothetical protein